jgi:hypothetical protein
MLGGVLTLRPYDFGGLGNVSRIVRNGALTFSYMAGGHGLVRNDQH